MKIIPLLQKLDSKHTKLTAKNEFHKKVTKGDFISVIYDDPEKEQVRLQQFTGVCTKLKSKGFNSKIYLQNVIGSVVVEQQFFFYSPSVVDIAILRQKNSK